jgi:hypothetical protein
MNLIEVLYGKGTSCQRKRLCQKRSLRQCSITPSRTCGIAAWVRARSLPLWRNALETLMPADFAGIQRIITQDTRMKGYPLLGKEETMPTLQQSESRSALDLDLIRCPRQPGNLRITRHACALRYLRSRETEPALPRTAFEMMCQSGLEKCRSCSMGRLYAKGLSSQAF